MSQQDAGGQHAGNRLCEGLTLKHVDPLPGDHA